MLLHWRNFIHADQYSLILFYSLQTHYIMCSIPPNGFQCFPNSTYITNGIVGVGAGCWWAGGSRCTGQLIFHSKWLLCNYMIGRLKSQSKQALFCLCNDNSETTCRAKSSWKLHSIHQELQMLCHLLFIWWKVYGKHRRMSRELLLG